MLRCGVVKYRALSVTCSPPIAARAFPEICLPFFVASFIIYSKEILQKGFILHCDYVQIASRDFLTVFLISYSAFNENEEKGGVRTLHAAKLLIC